MSQSTTTTGEFKVVHASLVVSAAPVFASNPRAGVEEMLDSMIMRYIPAFRGVVLAHSNLRFLERNAIIKGDCPFSIHRVVFEATVWSPHVGMKLIGRINLCSPDHVSLLVHRTFNVSIPRNHIPSEQWAFEYGLVENDSASEPYAEGSNEERQGHSGGSWVQSLTNEPLGGSSGLLRFTVIGLTVANEMLSLVGSIQDDPFAPEHVVKSGTSNRALENGQEAADDDASEVQVVDDSDLIEDEESSEEVLPVRITPQKTRNTMESIVKKSKRKPEVIEVERSAKKGKKRKLDVDAKSDEDDWTVSKARGKRKR